MIHQSETLTHMENIKYKGYIIAEETEPWARIYGIKYVIYAEGQQGPDNESLGFISVEDAKDHIDNNPVES